MKIIIILFLWFIFIEAFSLLYKFLSIRGLMALKTATIHFFH